MTDIAVCKVVEHEGELALIVLPEFFDFLQLKEGDLLAWKKDEHGIIVEKITP